MKAITVFLILAMTLATTAFAAGEPVRIAIIDTGIATAAIDEARVIAGHNYISSTDSTEDKIGHGTAIAGIIVGSSAAGVTGVCPDAALVPLVYYSSDETGKIVKGDADMVAQAIYAAIDIYGCRIINCSSGTDMDVSALQQAAQYAEEQGVLLVASAGNNNFGSPTARYYPAAYETVLCVGAAKQDGGVAAFSQRNDTVDILAPGTALWVTSIGGKKIRASGTSYATAYVSGAAAALWKEYPDLSVSEVRQILCASAVDTGIVGFDTDSGWGTLDSVEALTWAAQNRRFRDVTSDMWCFSGVNAVAKEGLLGGVDAAHFAPDDFMSRAMLFTALHRMSGKAEPLLQNGGIWYADATAWAQAEGISDGTIPNEAVTREQFTAMLYRFAKAPAVSGLTMTFVDRNKASIWATNALCWAGNAGIITGRSGNVLDPKGNITRAEAAVMLERYGSLALKLAQY